MSPVIYLLSLIHADLIMQASPNGLCVMIDAEAPVLVAELDELLDDELVTREADDRLGRLGAWLTADLSAKPVPEHPSGVKPPTSSDTP